jgi:PAS domain S-box-containing protein
MQDRNVSAVERFLTEDVGTFIYNFPANMYLVDRNFIIVGCSSYFARNFGYEFPEEIIGMSVHQFWLPQFAPDIIADSEYLFQTGEIVEAERPYVDCAGEEKLYLFRKTPLKDVDGSLYGFLALALDITAQKKLEALETR